MFNTEPNGISNESVNDNFDFVDEVEVAVGEPIQDKPWIILVVDDVPDIHEVTDLALKFYTIKNRLIQCLHAYTGKEAVDIVKVRTDIDLMLLDAVMETPDSGFTCAINIKVGLKRTIPIIVMRTGQAGNHNNLDLKQHPALDDILYKAECTNKVLYAMLNKWLN